MNKVVTRRMNILLVEGIAELSERIRRVIEMSRYPSRVHTVGDSSETLFYLRRQAPYGAAPKPDLVLLGLSRSSRDNVDIEEEFAANPSLADVQLVALDDPRLRRAIADDPTLAPDACECRSVELPVLGQLIDRIGSNSPHFARALNARES